MRGSARSFSRRAWSFMKSDLKRIFGAFGDAQAYAWAGARSPALA